MICPPETYHAAAAVGVAVVAVIAVDIMVINEVVKLIVVPKTEK